MSNFVVWLDSEKAEIFNLAEKGVVKSTVKKTSNDHHTRNPKNTGNDAGQEHFFQSVSAALKDGKEILLVGPGLGKNHLKAHLESHHAGLAKSIVGVETCDHPSDKQVLASARAFFKTYDLFNEPVTTA
jgi:stalled ribosome rescue protein Dom34